MERRARGLTGAVRGRQFGGRDGTECPEVPFALPSSVFELALGKWSSSEGDHPTASADHGSLGVESRCCGGGVGRPICYPYKKSSITRGDKQDSDIYVDIVFFEITPQTAPDMRLLRASNFILS